MIQHVRNCGFIIVIIDKQQYFYTDKTHTSQITGHRLATTHQHMMRPRLHQFHGKGVHSIREHSLNANLRAEICADASMAVHGKLSSLTGGSL